VQAEVEVVLHAGRVASTGIIALKMCSVWCATVEERAAWSSPATASTPPNCEVPAALAWRNTSPQRSTPGPLPYHIETRRRTSRPGKRLTCCVPQMAVAARSSLTPGWNLMWWASRCFFALPQRLVEPAQRRAAIAGDEAGGVEAGSEVAFPLHHRQAGKGLGAGEIDAAGRSLVDFAAAKFYTQLWAARGGSCRG
jgi:hypothetical protein